MPKLKTKKGVQKRVKVTATGKVKRKKEGAITVEMECASLLAVAKFRKIKLCQLICAGDDVSGELWDPRYVEDKMSIREKLVILSAEVCSSL